MNNHSEYIDAAVPSSEAEGDHDIIYDPADDLMPLARPVGEAQPNRTFDGRLLTAADLTDEQATDESSVVRIPITIKHGV